MELVGLAKGTMFSVCLGSRASRRTGRKGISREKNTRWPIICRCRGINWASGIRNAASSAA